MCRHSARIFANKRAVEICASIYIFEVGEVCDMSISAAIFFYLFIYSELCDELMFAICWSCGKAMAELV